MCEPTTIAIALAVTSAAVEAGNVIAEQKAAKAQNKAIGEQLQTTYDEVHQQETADVNDRLRAARKEQGRIKVAAGEAGLQLGGSVAGLLKDSTMQTALYDERVRLNADHKVDAASAEANSMYSRVQAPTLIGAGLRVGNAGLKGYSAGQGLQLSRAKVK